MVSDTQLEVLAQMIQEQIEMEFERVHYSGNLKNTIEVNRTANGFEVVIPAEMYDLWTYQNKGAIIYTGEGSYAQAVNEEGGFSGKHVDYVERAISNALALWNATYQLHGKVRVE